MDRDAQILEVRALSRALVRADDARRISLTWCDKAILGTSGLHPGHGPFTIETEESAFKANASAKAERTFVLADSNRTYPLPHHRP